MDKYRKKPIVIRAIKWDDNFSELMYKFPDLKCAQKRDDTLILETLEGTMTADMGDYIIKGIKGEFYPCKSDIFELTYEKVEDIPESIKIKMLSDAGYCRIPLQESYLKLVYLVKGIASYHGNASLDNDVLGWVTRDCVKLLKEIGDIE